MQNTINVRFNSAEAGESTRSLGRVACARSNSDPDSRRKKVGVRGGRGVPEQRHGFEDIFHVVERVLVCVDLVMKVVYRVDNAGKLSHVTRYSSEVIEEVGFSFL